jgi:predicted phosphodiesterase
VGDPLRALVLSDIHSNAAALQAVLRRVRRKRLGHVICLGDFVGYGAEPNQVLDVMRRIRATRWYVRGNHDKVAAGLDDGPDFGYAARWAAFWTRERLSLQNRAFLERLAPGPVQFGDLLLCHGAPYNEDEYVFTADHAALVFKTSGAPIVFYGHTHVPAVFSMDQVGRIHDEPIAGDGMHRLDPARRYLINPGSVGQPRDRVPASSFLTYDSACRIVQFFRVDYDLEKTKDAIMRAGLPPILADRLGYGT